MKIELEIRTSISRKQLEKVMTIVREAAERLAHRMTPQQLIKLRSFGQEIIRIADGQAKPWIAKQDRASAGPPQYEEIAADR